MAELLTGEAALEHLTSLAKTTDAGSSSHWQEMHQSLRIEGERVVSALGFGGFAPPHRGPRRWIHQLLQRRYRRMAAGYPEFARLDQLAAGLVARQGRAYDLDVLRQAVTTAFLAYHAPQVFDGQAPVLVIGDGFGTLSALLASAFPKVRIVLINLTQTLLVDLMMLRKGLPDLVASLASDEAGLTAAIERPDLNFVALRADNQQLLSTIRLGLAVNVASMQEMRSDTIAGYFTAMRAAPGGAPLFYCCNREEKQLPDGETVRFADYPWEAGDKILLDELCPWHQHYYSLRPPLYHPYDGPHRHRLVRLTSGQEA
ncbi:MAG: putative sugar O-methyltransferase [Kiloniellales bacterium]